MRTAVGIFPSRADASRACEELEKLGLTEDRLTMLQPASADIESVPTTDAEPPGIGAALGGVAGGAAGVSGGGLVGSAVASFFVPGVGPIAAIGFAAAAAGAAGAVAGASAGKELDRILSTGLPKDELFFYEDALRQGRSVLIAVSDDEGQLDAARRLLAKEGAEALDAARHEWWIGLQDSQSAEYEIPEAGAADAASYRLGFEAALEPGARGRRYEEALDYLKNRHPHHAAQDAFRRGFENGQAYYEKNVTALRRASRGRQR